MCFSSQICFHFEAIFSPLKIHKNYKTAFKSSYAVAILTEWDEFKNYKWEKLIKDLKKPVRIFDGRNVLKRDKVLNKIYRIGIA